MEALKKLNLKAAVAHIGSFLCVILLFSYYKNSQKHAKAQTFRYSIPIPESVDPPKSTLGGPTCNSEFTTPEQVAGRCQTDPIYAPPRKTYSFNIIYGCLLFFAITAFAHIFYATDGFGSGNYSQVILEGWNPYRWVEYGISASVMTVLIAYSLGIRDSNHLLSLIFINVVMQTMGFIVENSLIQTQINPTIVKTATFAGWTLLLGIWIPIIYAFKTVLDDIKNNFEGLTDPSENNQPIKIPSWVWFIIIVQIINFSSFGVIQYGQVSNALAGKVVDYSVYERRYLILSFAGKIGLAAGLAYGLIFRTRNCTS